MNALLQGAIASLTAHPAVESVEQEELEHGAVNARAVFRVDLPSRWAAQGRSANGVLLREEVLVQFAVDFPKSAPRFSLRPDFPTNLPHIYPHRRGARIPPCITFGDKRDVMHKDGMWRLVDQMSDWLDKAAVNALTNNEQGWEPTRRDVDFNLLQVDTQELTARTPPFGGWRMFSCFGVWGRDSQGSFASEPLPVRPLTNLVWLQEMLRTHKTDGAVDMGRVPVVVCWPTSSSPEGPIVNDRYQADRVATFAELAEQASAWDCRVALDDFLSNIGRSLRNGQVSAILPLYLVFPVRRPLHVIGTQSDYEMIAYRMQLTLPAVVSATDLTPVVPIAFLSPVSRGLLRRTSGLKPREEHASPVRFTLAGCGSLGSKIAMHLARAGLTPSLLIDRRFFLGHNAARHVLLPEDVQHFQAKATRLSRIIGSFGSKKPSVYEGDLRDLPFQTSRYRDAFDSGAVIVNTTGSSALRDYLTKATFDARVFEGALIDHGSAAVMTLEGRNRNPRSADLMFHCYQKFHASGILRDERAENANLLEVGVGCHSVTMPMSDARVSLVASGLGQKLLSLDEEGLPDSGVAATAFVGSDGMSIQWAPEAVGPTHLAQLYNDEGWTVRVLDAAHQEIVDDIARYPTVETGGLIVGHVSALTREVFVTGVLAAPPDSERTAGQFVLGVQGRAQAIAEYQEAGGSTLWCLGTWHSHLQVSGPSQMDRDTASRLDGQLRHAAVLLIRHPAGYAAIVRDGLAR